MCDLVDVVGVGLNATDTVMAVGEYPRRGSKVEFRGEEALAGGQVATAVVACRGWGLTARYVGKVGEDDGARVHRAAFERAGVDARLVVVPGGASAQSFIVVDGGGERTVLCRRDERLTLRPEEVKRDWVVRGRALLVDGYDTAAATCAAGWAREVGVPVVADLDEVYVGVAGLLELVDYAIVSRDFPCKLMGVEDLGGALRGMKARFGCGLVAATLGEDGVVAWDGKSMVKRAAYRVPVVDTTGAGDVFHAGFIYGLVRGWGLERMLDFGCAAAALNCERVGARGGLCGVEGVEALMGGGERYGVLG